MFNVDIIIWEDTDLYISRQVSLCVQAHVLNKFDKIFMSVDIVQIKERLQHDFISAIALLSKPPQHAEIYPKLQTFYA